MRDWNLLPYRNFLLLVITPLIALGCSSLKESSGDKKESLVVTSCLDYPLTVGPDDWAIFRWYDGNILNSTRVFLPRLRVETYDMSPEVPVRIHEVDPPHVVLTSPEWTRAENVLPYGDERVVEIRNFQYGLRLDLSQLASITRMPGDYEPDGLKSKAMAYPGNLGLDLVIGAASGVAVTALIYLTPPNPGSQEELDEIPPPGALLAGAIAGAIIYPIFKFLIRPRKFEDPLPETDRNEIRTYDLEDKCRFYAQ